VDVLAPPYLLIATPLLRDPNFHETVVLMAHHDADGALGWIVNRVHDQKARDVLDPRQREQVDASTPLHIGGPVPDDSLLVVFHEPRPELDAQVIAPGLYASRSPSALPALFAKPSASDLVAGRLIHGYSGWNPRQLEAEMEAGAWLVLPYARELAFAADVESVWRRCFERLGVHPAMMTAPSGTRH
jgi:putative transcriptional regulator